MGFVTLFAVPLFEKKSFQKWIRYTFLAHSIITPLIAFVYFYPNFSEKLLLIATPWLITGPLSMLLPAVMFKRIANARNQQNITCQLSFTSLVVLFVCYFSIY
jgi:hypothetical protein